MIVRNILYIVLLTVYMERVFKANTMGIDVADISPLILLLLSAIALIACFMEMRLVTTDGKIMLPLARYLLFCSKILVAVADFAILALLKNFVAVIVLNAVVLATICIVAKLLLNTYDNTKQYYIDYFCTTIDANAQLKSAIVVIAIACLVCVSSVVWLIVLIVNGITTADRLGVPVFVIVLSAIFIVVYAVMYRKVIRCNKEKERDSLDDNKYKKR